MRRGVVRLEFQRMANRGDSFVELAPSLERVAQIIENLRVIGFEFERTAIRGNGFVEPALPFSRARRPDWRWASG